MPMYCVASLPTGCLRNRKMAWITLNSGTDQVMIATSWLLHEVDHCLNSGSEESAAGYTFLHVKQPETEINNNTKTPATINWLTVSHLGHYPIPLQSDGLLWWWLWRWLGSTVPLDGALSDLPHVPHQPPADGHALVLPEHVCQSGHVHGRRIWWRIRWWWWMGRWWRGVGMPLWCTVLSSNIMNSCISLCTCPYIIMYYDNTSCTRI